MKLPTSCRLVLTLAALLALPAALGTGCCTAETLCKGFGTFSMPLTKLPFGQEAKLIPEIFTTTPPRAVKDANGDLVVEYEVGYWQNGPFGGSGIKKGVTRRKWVIARSALVAPAEVSAELGRLVEELPVSASSLLPPGMAVPVMHSGALGPGWAYFPLVECVFIIDGNLYWCVPPNQEQRTAQMVLIEGRRENSPWYAWPPRLVVLPCALFADIFLNFPKWALCPRACRIPGCPPRWLCCD